MPATPLPKISPEYEQNLKNQTHTATTKETNIIPDTAIGS